MKEDILGRYAVSVPAHIQKEVDWSMDIADHIDAVLKERCMSHRALALLTGKKEAEVSRWLSGSHNFTIRTLALISCALGVDLINTREKSAKSAKKRVRCGISGQVSKAL